MVRSLLITAAILLSFTSKAQTFLNGDFENTTVTNCTYNLDNGYFNSVMPDVNSFGNTFHAGLFGEADIITGTCVGGPHNGWSVMIACEATTTDKLSLELDEALTIGETYEVSFYGMANTIFNPDIHPVAVGYSTVPASLGITTDTIYFNDTAYSQETFTFTATTAARYITITVVPDGATNGSVKIDEFTINTLVSVKDQERFAVSLSPNPVRDRLNISGNESATFELYDLTGKKCISQFFANGENKSVSVAGLPSGIYIARVIGDKGTFEQRVVVQ